MTTTQLERLRLVTDIELSTPSPKTRRASNHSDARRNVQHCLDRPSLDKRQKYCNCDDIITGDNGNFNDDPSPLLKLGDKPIQQQLLPKQQFTVSEEEHFRSPAIPRKTCAQNMIQSSHYVSPESFVSSKFCKTLVGLGGDLGVGGR